MLSVLYNSVKYARNTAGIKGGNAERVRRVAKAKPGLGKIAMGSILRWMKANALWDSKDEFGCTMSSHEWVASTSTLLDYIVERSSSTKINMTYRFGRSWHPKCC